MSSDRDAAGDSRLRPPDGLPPGQRLVKGWPVSHYGPVPRFRPDRWDLKVFGTTAAGDTAAWTLEELTALPHHRRRRPALRNRNNLDRPRMVRHSALLEAAPPAPGVAHVMAWAESGSSANLRLSDRSTAGTLLATHRNGEVLTAEHGFPYGSLCRTSTAGKASSGCVASST